MKTIRAALSSLHGLLVRAAFLAFQRLVPARDDVWCFATWDSYAHTLDNPRAVFEEVKHRSDIRKIVFQKAPGRGPPAREGVNVSFVPAESLRGAYHLARSRTILLGYALRGICSYALDLDPHRHRIVQLWHGIPLKRIGKLFPPETFWHQETGRYAATVCSSERDREIMAKAFDPIPRERVWLTGLPRNDLLLMDEGNLPGDYREHLHRLDDRLDGRRLVLYAPTWRQRTESQYAFSDEDVEGLDEVLTSGDAVLGVRGHANVRGRSLVREDAATGRIIGLNDLPDVSVILRRTDVLVTDYSSIYIDFLLLDRPIIHFVYDLESYMEERGFLYQPEEAFAGPQVRSAAELVDGVERALQDTTCHRERRQRARRLFHGHRGSPSEEVVRRIEALHAEP